MKRKTILILCGILFLAYPLSARKVTVTVRTPGMLPTLISPEKKNKITELTLKGTLNGTDLRFLREMAGSDLNQKATGGQLQKVDLSKATFALGGEAYILKDGARYPTGAYTIPKFLFRNCRIEEVLLPVRTDTIGVGAFEYSSLKHIQLPEHAVLDSWAFNGCKGLQEVLFPAHIQEIRSNCFQACDALKRLSLNQVNHISAYSILNLPSLERIEVHGYVLSIRGLTVDRCPQLRNIDFYGPVLTVDMPSLASNCERLEAVTFHDFVLSADLSESRNCPLLKDYTYRDIRFFCDLPEGLPEEQTALHSTLDYPRMFEKMALIYREQKDPRFFNKPWIATVFYNGACSYAARKEKEKTLYYLETAVEMGYDDYKGILQRTDFDSLVEAEKLAALRNLVRERGDYIYLLQRTAPYERMESSLPGFTYSLPTEENLIRVREYFNLDSIAGPGDELSRIKNLMYWLHNTIRHTSNMLWPDCRYNAIDLYELAQRENKGYNCRFLAMILNEIYLAAGFQSRFLICQSKNYDTDPDCHVINVVWSRTLRKWVWMDPSFAAYVSDENGLLLHPGEVRKRLVKGLPLMLNEDANCNQQPETKEWYLDHYMAKNLYLISAHLASVYETEGKGGKNSPVVVLSPLGFQMKGYTLTYDDVWFWQAPE